MDGRETKNKEVEGKWHWNEEILIDGCGGPFRPQMEDLDLVEWLWENAYAQGIFGEN
jgi:hypothetical protein